MKCDLLQFVSIIKQTLLPREDADILSSSQVQRMKLDEVKPENERAARLFFTVWAHSHSTTTLTSVTTDPATTVSLTYGCTGTGFTVPLIACN